MGGCGLVPNYSGSFESLTHLLSTNRFETFLRGANRNPDRALRLYAWNIEISSAFWGSFHMLEVSLRNALHSQLAKVAKREDWWYAELRLYPDTREKIRNAISSAAKKQAAKGIQMEPGHVMAELSLGFWNGMLANRYQRNLWEKSLRYAFPHYTGRRGPLHDDLERLRMLRNRIAHHEPIFERDLAIDHEKICDLIGYLDPEIRAWALKNSRIPEILQVKELRLSGQLESSF